MSDLLPVQEPGEVLAARLREGRRALGLTQWDVADAIAVPRSAVSAIETGTRNVTGLELRRLARLYRRSVGWLLGEIEDADVDPGLVAVASQLTPHDQDTVLRFARFLASQHPEVAEP